MIKKLDNGNTVITLGEGTVFVGNVHVNDDKIASGIYFSNNREGMTDDGIIIEMSNKKAVASYLMALVRFLETWEDDKESQFNKNIEGLKKDLEKYLVFNK